MDARGPCAGCIHIMAVTSAGDTAGPGWIEEAQYVAEDPHGNLWIGQRGGIKLFDNDGKYVRALGRQGAGPLEFQRPGPILRDSHARIHVFDSRNQRQTTFDQNAQLLTEIRSPGLVQAAAMLPDSDRYVANFNAPLGADTASLLHIVAGASIVRSFGNPGEVAPNINPWDVWRVVAASSDGKIYSAKLYDSEIEAWSIDGRQIARFRGPPLNDSPPLPGPWSDDNPPPNRVMAMGVDSAGLLWVVSWMRRDDWRRNMGEQTNPDGSRFLRPLTDDMRVLFESRIAIIDPESGDVIAQAVTTELLAGYLGGDRWFESRVTASGHPEVVVHTLRLTS